MQQIDTVLRGLQAAIIPEIEAYWIENPVPADKIARVTHSGWITTTDGQHLNPLHYTPEQPRKRIQVGWIEERWGNKNREKQSLSLYYCYYASEWELHGEGSKSGRKKQRIYLQTHQCQEIGQMVREKRPYNEILEAIGRTKRHSDKPHHTQEPKI